MRCAVMLLIAVTACGGKAPTPAAPPALAAERAAQDAKAVIEELYRALRSGDTDDLLSLVTDELVVIGPRPLDLRRSRTEAVMALRERIDPRHRPRLASSGPKISVAPGGRSAYVVDHVRLAGRPLIVAALIDGQDSIWRVSAVQLAAPVNGKAAKKAMSTKTLSAPGASAAEAPAGSADPAPRFAATVAAPSAWIRELADHPGATWISADGREASGPRALGRIAKQLGEVVYQTTSPISVIATRDTRLALVTCLATRQLPGGPALPLRLTAIYQRASDTAWQLVMLQESQAIEPPR